MDLADFFELGSLAVFVLGIYWATGRAGAAIAGALALLVIGLALDGTDVHPLHHVRHFGCRLWKKVRDRS